MRSSERVVFTFRALGEAGKAAAFSQRADAILSPGENLVRIGLMANIPDQPVGRRIEQIVDRDCKLDDAQPGAKMSAGDGDSLDRLLAQLICDLAQVALR